jgi:hypothetical protein
MLYTGQKSEECRHIGALGYCICGIVPPSRCPASPSAPLPASPSGRRSELGASTVATCTILSSAIPYPRKVATSLRAISILASACRTNHEVGDGNEGVQ